VGHTERSTRQRDTEQGTLPQDERKRDREHRATGVRHSMEDERVNPASEGMQRGRGRDRGHGGGRGGGHGAGHRPTAPARHALLLALALSLLGWAAPLRAQPAPAAPAPAAAAQPKPAAQAARPTGPLVDESFSIRHDEDLYQLEEAVTLISGSLSRIADKVNTLAINSFTFGMDVDPDFRTKAEVIILEKLLNSNANVKLVQCQECQKLETKIVNGVLRLKKGIPSQEARLELAKKLGVDGFIDIGMFRNNRQLTIYLKVVEAETGAIILVDEVVGRQAGKRDAVTLAFGEFNFPIVFGGKTYNHNTLAFTVTEQVQLTQRFSFGVDLVIYTDNNQLSTDPHMTLDAGLLLSPFLGFDLVQLPQSTSRLIGYLGLGKLLSPQLNYGDVYRTGVQFIVGDRLVVTIGLNQFDKTNVQVSNSDKSKEPLLANGAQLNGVGYELRFGYRF